VPFTGPNSTLVSVIWGVLTGIVGTVIWVLLLVPFVDADADKWSNSAFFLRLTAASILVPIFEELLMRGYILRLAYQWDRERRQNKKDALSRALNERCINNVEPGAWSIAAVLVSTIAFMLGHQFVEWPAAFIYGILMTLLWIKRKDLIACIVAHGTTNFTLGLYVWLTKHWELW
jgi:membrane protease YdiL (CAAX protease family)